MLNLLEITCNLGESGATLLKIPSGVAGLIHLVILILQIAVPIMLVIWGMLDFAKATIGGDEDKIKSGQKIFIKRLVAAILVFLVVTVVQLVITAVGTAFSDSNDKSADNAWSCACKIIHNSSSGC
ncbi:MAG: hypothetical protein IJ093_02945 [Bacilli bacterium]|nr:hypothetical protein [Bacilli bacterium]